MKKLVLVIALVSIAVAGNAFAQAPGYANNIGIFFDEAATNNCGSLAIFTPVTGYVALTQLTATSVSAWEAKLTFSNLLTTGFANRGQAIDAASRPDEHVVGFASPLPVSGGVCVVAEVGFYVDNTAPAAAYVDETFLSLFENGLPAFIDGSGEGFPLYPLNSTGDAGSINDPIMVVNGSCLPVGVESSTFGNVKSLFR